MKILAIEKEIEGKVKADFAPFLLNEAAEVWKLYKEGVIREIYFNEHNNAVMMLECDDNATAREILNTLPLVKNNLITFEISALTPYKGFERLFNH